MRFSFKRAVLLLTVPVIGIISLGGLSVRQDRLSSITSPYAYNLVIWEANNFFDKWLYKVEAATFGRGNRTEDKVDLVKRYFAVRQDERSLERRINEANLKTEDGQIDSQALSARLTDLKKQASDLQREVEAVLESQVSQIMIEEGLGKSPGLGLNFSFLFPPVDFKFERPPSVLIVSPRDKIEIKETRLLRPGMIQEDMETLEAQVENLGVSALVENIGGISTYPSIIPLDSSLESVLSTIAHEWLHAFLFFQPLGQRYWSGYEMTSINETVADIAGNEVGARLLKLYRDSRDDAGGRRGSTSSSQPAFDFNKEMREIRLAVDRLLAEGQVDQAESLMREKQRFLASEGYFIRKLNQAYFAFHGGYADGPTSVNPIGEELRRLRTQSASLGEFVKRAAQIKSRQELQQLIGN